MRATITGQRESPDRVVIEQIGNALQSDTDVDADILADDQHIDYTGLILEEVVFVLSRQRLVPDPGLAILPPIVAAIVLWGKWCIVILDVIAQLPLARTAGLDDNFVLTKIDTK
ncbi:unnamed protein product [Sphagnum balticum]